MTFSEQELKYFADVAYWIDDKKKDKKFLPEEGTIRKVPRKIKGNTTKYKILKVEDNITNGMQAMAVAPFINGKVDTSEITIAYAGTNSDDDLDIRTDAQTVVVGSKLLDTSTLFKPADSLIEGQVITAENFAEDIKKNYPNAVVSTTGHSLGEFIALYVAAENGWKNVGFNGPDPYKLLSDDAKVWVEENPGMLFNYRNKKDLIGNFGGNQTGAEILVNMGTDGKSHNLSTWEFDEKGHLIIKDTYANKDARLVQAEKLMYARMIELALLTKKFRASGGGLSTNEEIYLNDTEALIVIESASNSMKIGLEYIIKIYQDAILGVEEVWAEGIQRAQLIATELSYNEIIDALAAGGATKYTIVNKPTAYYEGKIANAKQIEVSFNRLATDIKASIKKVKDTDEDLARQISQGVWEMEKSGNVEKEYRLKRRNYEEQEEDLICQRNKGIATLEEVQDRSRYYLKDFVPESDMLTRGLHQIEQMKEEVLEKARVDRQKLARKLEELDENYYSQMKKLFEKEEKGDNL